MLSHSQLLHLESILNYMKQQNDKNISQLEQNSKQMLDDQSSELSTADNHPADLGTELFDLERDRALIDHLKFDNKKIEEAYKAMKNGTYGICRVCHQEIPFERLQVVPNTAYCVEHAHMPDTLIVERNQYYTDKAIISKPMYRDEPFFQEFAEDFMDILSEFDDIYDESFDSEDNVQEIENIAAVDMEGNKYVYHTRQLEQYERNLDDDEIDYLYGTLPDADYEDNF